MEEGAFQPGCALVRRTFEAWELEVLDHQDVGDLVPVGWARIAGHLHRTWWSERLEAVLAQEGGWW